MPDRMLILTTWNRKRAYVDPHEIAIIEPADAHLATIAGPRDIPIAGSVVTLAAGRSIAVTENADSVYEQMRALLTEVTE